MCVYVCVYVHVCMCVCVYVCMHACMCVCMYMFMHICIHACMLLHAFRRTHTESRGLELLESAAVAAFLSASSSVARAATSGGPQTGRNSQHTAELEWRQSRYTKDTADITREYLCNLQAHAHGAVQIYVNTLLPSRYSEDTGAPSNGE